MATGSPADIVTRLQAWLPTRWFPTQTQNADGSVPRIYALLCGFAANFAGVWNQLQYARAQTRLSTSTDGWLDLGVADYAGDALPRNPGEADTAYWARVQPQLLPKANTRANIQATLESLTGQPVRMIEPWDPRDTAVYGYRTFYGVDLSSCPGEYSNGANRYCGAVQCVLPASAEIGSYPTRRFYNSGAFYGNGDGGADGQGWYWNGSIAASGGAELVYALLNRLKVFGTQLFVRFENLAGDAVPPVPQFTALTDDSGDILTDDSGDILTP